MQIIQTKPYLYIYTCSHLFHPHLYSSAATSLPACFLILRSASAPAVGIQSQMQQTPNPNQYHLRHPLQLHHLQQQQQQLDGGGGDAGCSLFRDPDYWVTTDTLQNVVYGGGGDVRAQNPNVGIGQLRFDNQEIDSYINFQSEKLWQMVQEQRKLELSWLVKSLETRASALVKQKDEQIWQLMLRTMELERVRSRLQLENESLQTISRQNQTTIQSLRQAIDLLHRENEVNSHLAEDVGSCCDVADLTTRVELEEKVNGDGEKLGVRVMCGGCGWSREASVVFLPCRHLCACDVCGDEMSFCPICKEEKNSSIMTLVF